MRGDLLASPSPNPRNLGGSPGGGRENQSRRLASVLRRPLSAASTSGHFFLSRLPYSSIIRSNVSRSIITLSARDASLYCVEIDTLSTSFARGECEGNHMVPGLGRVGVFVLKERRFVASGRFPVTASIGAILRGRGYDCHQHAKRE